MSKKILITGGAGFIGSHLADELLMAGHQVRILDNLCEQVHGPSRERPEYLNLSAELFVGDVCKKDDVKHALRDIDVVYHLASCVGVGQSMYQVRHYTKVNNLGTATLLEVLMDHPVEKLVVASSMSIYGEGLYRDHEGNLLETCSRQLNDLRNDKWELYDEQQRPLKPVAVTEDKKPNLSSVYALSKYDQERLCLILGEAYGIPTTALRFFNVYGTRQALSNPYTGVLAIFASRLLNNNPPLIFEDGHQQRDFIHVKDVARACRLAMEKPESNGMALNIGSGNNYSIRFLAEQLAQVMGKEDLGYEITGKYRVGDIRHCFADMSRAREYLGFEPRVELKDGMLELAHWLKGQIAVDKVGHASSELAARGLTV